MSLPPPPPPPRRPSVPPPPPPVRAVNVAPPLPPPPAPAPQTAPISPPAAPSAVKPPPPPAQPVVRADLPAPPPPAQRAPRAPLSRKAKLGIGGLAAGLILAATAVFVIRHLGSTPPAALLLATLDREVGAEKLRFNSATQKATSVGSDQVRIVFTTEGKVTEPLYLSTDLATTLPAEYETAKNRLAEADRLMASRTGARLRETGGLGAPPEDPRQVEVIRATAKLTDSFSYQGEAHATRTAEGWRLQLTDGRFSSTLPEGQPRRGFGAKTYLASEAQDVAALKTLLAERLAYSERALAAATKLAAQLAEERNARLQEFQAQLKPGTIFTGLVRDLRNPQSHSVTLEITAFSPVVGSVTALLRNDGGWADTRTFQGTWKPDAEAEHVTVALASRQNQAVRSAGPILEANEDFALTFALTTSGTLRATTARFELTLSRVPDTEVAALRTQLGAELVALLGATAPDLVYRGAAISKNTQVAEPVLIRLIRQENGGALLQAMLESPDHGTWQRSLRGTLIANRYRSEGRPLRLQIDGEDRVKRAPGTSIFGANAKLSLRLAVDSDQITGEDERYSYRLKRAAAAELAELKAARDARDQRFLSVIRSGAAYDGTARDRAGAVSRLRLRVNQFDSASQTVGVLFESREQNGIFHAMSGSYDVESGSLLLGSSGQGKFNPSGRLKVPFFSRDRGFKVALQLTAAGLVGEVSNESWTLDFPVGATAAATPLGAIESEFPAAPGAYVKGKDGQWVPLPTNDGKVTYGATEVLKNISGLLGALSGKTDEAAQTRPDKLADLTFAGRNTLPVVSGENVVFAFVGTIKQAPADMIQKYPELADYPQIELAPTRTLADGRRQVDLLRIVPGLAGFREGRVAATIDQPKDQTWVLSCTRRLLPGTYALVAGESSSEVAIR